MMRYKLLGLLILALIVPTSAINTTLSYYCPPVMTVDDVFTVWADYELESNNSDILNATVILNSSLTNTTLNYVNSSSEYNKEFQVITNLTWNYTITASKLGYDTKSVNCSTQIVYPFEVTVNLWEEVELQTVVNTSNYIVTQKNYNKQLTDPYINEFAYIVARNNDLNFTGAYDYCNFPFSPGSQIWDGLYIPNYMGNDPDSNSLDDLKALGSGYIGCNNAWYRGEYIDGSAIINLTLPGKYSLYLVDGTLEWENEVSPPKLIKSSLFIYLGDINREDTSEVTYDFYITHSELDAWGAFTDNLFLLMVTLIPLLLFIFLILVGFSVSSAGTLALSWTVIWTLINLVF